MLPCPAFIKRSPDDIQLLGRKVVGRGLLDQKIPQALAGVVFKAAG
jgi:hypothetical protein